MNPNITYHDGDICMSQWYNVQFSDMHGTMRLRHLPLLERSYRELIAKYPQGVVSLSIVSGTTQTERQIARESAAMAKRVSASIRQISVVVEVSGVFGAMVRTTLRGIAVIMNQPYAFKVHDNLRTAVDELVPLVRAVTNGPITSSEMLKALTDVRASYTKLKSEGAEALRP